MTLKENSDDHRITTTNLSIQTKKFISPLENQAHTSAEPWNFETKKNKYFSAKIIKSVWGI